MNVPRRQFLNVLVFITLTMPSSFADTKGKSDDTQSLSWPQAWATCIVSGNDRNYASVADGLLLRPGSVVAFSASDLGASEHLYDHPASVWSVAVSPDGTTLASSDYKGNLAIYDVASKKVAISDGVLERWTRALTFSHDGEDVIAGNENGKLIVYSVEAAKVSKTADLDAQQVFDVALSPDGKTLTACDSAGHVHLLSYPELKAVRKVECGKQPIWSVAFSGDGKQIFAGGADRQLCSIAVEGEAKPDVIGTTRDWITDLCLDADTSRIAVGTMDATIYLRDRDQFGKVGVAPSGVWSIAFAGKQLLTATRKHQVTALGPPWKIEVAAAKKQEEPKKQDEAKEGSEEEDPFAKKKTDEKPAAEAK